ncbi:hypothetical protein MF672_004350 [Actinomadura sp. ATCC 31491]|uniref:Uncharacterized protein n=1 Tax=Actinomadura luzonensis TaxID=2805427 RepID=A0ABT0FLV0_9ACTN|nr:hypothetical protein [Actinomadura luzonensis]MCK2213030.1 hypothetical protein [Actinomadura luzonensis]
MRVELAGGAFTEDRFELIVTLIRLFAESRHEWVVTPDQFEIVRAYFQEHAPTRAQAYALMAQKGAVSQAWSAGPATLRPVVSVTYDSMPDHVEDLTRPARLVVENQEGDGAFVLALAHVFEAGQVIRAHGNRWLEFVQGGGSGEVPKVVASEAATFRRVKRVAFLFDSDRMVPGEASKHEKAVAALGELGVPGHVLRFREAENYVPNRVLAAIAGPRRELAARIDALKKLDPHQRGHFDFKHGFWDRKKACPAVPDAQKDLYAPLPDHVMAALRNGFGENLTVILEREARAGKLKEADFEALGPEVVAELKGLLALLQEII